jgi:3-dehydroquinate synthase
MVQPIDAGNYRVYFEDDSFHHLNHFLSAHCSSGSRIFILTDLTVADACLPFLLQQCPMLEESDVIEIHPGEENKVIETCCEIWKILSDEHADRNMLMINLGGGVVCDLGGFAASMYKRGVEFIHVPTTLLSMVDASVGGKTGIDFEGWKNQIGTFADPQGVFVFPPFLDTLQPRQMHSGFAEVIKHAALSGLPFLDQVESLAGYDLKIPDDLIRASIIIKKDIVLSDPMEKGLRKVLNFGHTIGHAIESYSLMHDDNPLLHGEAIAIGMICEGYLSMKMKGLGKDELHRLCDVIHRVFAPYPLSSVTFHELMHLMKGDKKNKGTRINFTLLSAWGNPHFDCHPDEELVVEALHFYVQQTIGKIGLN